jgi:hypothetical protein
MYSLSPTLTSNFIFYKIGLNPIPQAPSPAIVFFLINKKINPRSWPVGPVLIQPLCVSFVFFFYFYYSLFFLIPRGWPIGSVSRLQRPRPCAVAQALVLHDSLAPISGLSEYQTIPGCPACT